MAQITVRADDELVQRVKRSAAGSGRSMNDFVTAVLDAATDPNLVGDAAERLRERLRAAGLLEAPAPKPGERPTAELVAEAGRRAATGRPLSEFVSDAR
jgi:plasmid stability protein